LRALSWNNFSKAVLNLSILKDGQRAFLGEARPSLEQLNEQLRQAEAAGDPWKQGIALNNLGDYFKNQNDQARAREYFQHALQFFTALADQERKATVLHNLAASYLATKDYAKALEHFAMALGTYGALNQAFGQGMALNNMGGVQLTLGQYEQARKQFILSASFFRSAQEPSWEAQSLENLAAAEAGMGNPKAAMESYSRALELWQKLEQHDRQAMILNRIAGLRIGKGEKRTALELHSRALALAQKSGSATVLASTRISLGRLYFEAKNFSLARTEFQAALLLYEEQRDKRGQATTFLDIARLNFAAGEELVRGAMQLFREIGDKAAEEAARDLLPQPEPEAALRDAARKEPA
jgi:tetratricopeptide (TPR) repeat protein